ncbi:MAG: hypothetical protein WBV23_10010 [Desulfobaccales bacterium]
MDISSIREVKAVPRENIPRELTRVAQRMVQARRQGRAIIFMLGAHVLRAGVQHYLIDLMARQYVSCLAGNGACMIHDFEFALLGATTESVARYIVDGRFGLWLETGYLNDLINAAYQQNPACGMGETVGRAILEGDYPYKDVSVFAAAVRWGVPVTVHVGIGYDIIHEHPNCNGAATGQLSYNDFLRLVTVVQDLKNGVVMNFGSAVMAPEVFLKALSMARNVARQEGRGIRNFCSLVCDIRDLSGDFTQEPPKTSPAYYFRPWKTMLVRAVQEGGESFYVRGLHDETIPALWTAIGEAETQTGAG